jgi:hypothetical protein
VQTFNEQKRDDLRSLLESHQKVCDALFNIEKTHFVIAISVTDEKNDDITEVELHHSVAKPALEAHKEWIDAELKKLGVEINPVRRR